MQCWWDCEMVQLLWKTVQQFHKKTKRTITYGPAMPTLDIYPKELKAGIETDICIFIFIAALLHNSQKVETTQGSINKWIKYGLYIQWNFKMEFSLKKEENSGTYYNMEVTWKHANWNKPVIKRTHTAWLYLHEINGVVKLLEIRSRMVVSRSLGRGEWVWSFHDKFL